MFSCLSIIKSREGEPIPIYDYFFAAIGLIATLLYFFSYERLVHRQGILAHLEFLILKYLTKLFWDR
jgi:TRAP-type uncharacterized transport system fused permease subunit